MSSREWKSRERAANFIRQLVKDFDEHPWDINCGRGEEFAKELAELLGPDAEAICVEDLDQEYNPDVDDGINHSIVVFDGFYYDAEEPFGVEDWRHLPLCARQLRLRKNHP